MMKPPFHILTIVLILALWITATYPLLHWFFGGVSLHYDVLSASLAMAVLVLWWRSSKPKTLFPAKTLYLNRSALTLGTACFIGFVFFKNQANIRIVSLTLAALTLYSMFSVFMKPENWNKGLLPFSLLLMTLPFGRHLDIMLGYPLRLMAVELSYQLLSHVYDGLTSTNTLLVIENNASHVDMDCSGLRGLWVGLLFFLGIAWIEKAPLNARTFTALLVLVGSLIAGNIVRVMALAVVQLNERISGLDPWIHHSTSVFFMLVSCAMAFAILKTGQRRSIETPSPTDQPLRVVPSWTPIILIAVLVTMILTPAFKPVKTGVVNHASLALEIKAAGWEPVNLSASEAFIFNKEGVEALKFEQDSLEMMLVLGGDWRVHHLPEICYDLAGFTLSETKTVSINKDFSLRSLAFDGQQAKAFYWFQSAEMATDDYATKIWRQIFDADNDWTQVSLINKNGTLPLSDIHQLQQLIHSSL